MKKYIALIYIIILWVSVFYTIISHFYNLTIISIEHYFGILILIITTTIFIYKRNWINKFLLLLLTIGLFNYIQFIPDLTTINLKSDIQTTFGHSSLSTININLYFIILLITFIMLLSKTIYITIKDVFSENQTEIKAKQLKINESLKEKANKLGTHELEEIMNSDLNYTKDYKNIISQTLKERKNYL